MKTPVVIGIVAALHGIAIGTLMLTQGCGTLGGRTGGPVTFEEQAPVLPKPDERAMLPDRPVKPVIKPERTVKPAVKPAPAAKRYTVQQGDTMGHIAQRFKVNMAEIREMNPDIKDFGKIRAGQTLALPAYVDLSAPPVRKPASAPAVKPASAPVAAGGGEYLVQSGDTLGAIALKHGVKTDDLMKLNKITDPKRLRIGQKLAIPGAAAPVKPADVKPADPAPVSPFGPMMPPVPPAPTGTWPEPEAELAPMIPAGPAVPAVPVAPAGPPAGEAGPALLRPAGGTTHVVMPGDVLRDIALLYNVTADEIQQANKLTGEQLTPGQTLTIPPSR